MLLLASFSYAQDQAVTDDLGNVEDKFQDYFFEALKQKGIENYERAIEALEKCLEIQPEQAVIYFELGKNHNALKQYDEAERHLKKALELDSSHFEILIELYDVYAGSKNYTQAIITVKKLIRVDSDYKEDLANLLVRTKKYGDALKILNQLDDVLGRSQYRDSLRQEIYSQSNNKTNQIIRLKQQLIKQPHNEKLYLDLIFLYSKKGDENKAFKTAKDLLKEKPNSNLVHLALYKFYLNQNQGDNAIVSIKKVLEASEIDKESKLKTIRDFIAFVSKNPIYEKSLVALTSLLSTEEKPAAIYLQLGDYYLAKNQKLEALKFYELGVKTGIQNFNLLKNTLLLQIDQTKYNQAAQLSSNALDVFPSQAILYLLNGIANNALNNSQIAIESLEIGIDYVIENPKMEGDFYLQLSKAYQNIGDEKKAKLFLDKAQKLKKSKHDK